MADAIRAFVAIRLSSQIEDAIAGFQNKLRHLDGEISWTRPAAFHLTLRFLGNGVPPEVIEKMRHGLRSIADATAPFIVRAHGAGAFPSLNRPRVIWIGLIDGQLGPLAAEVETLSVNCGFEPERRPFTPHLTIGRVRNPKRDPRMREALEQAANLDFGSCSIELMTLYRSHLSPHGATYEALATLPFRAP
jgi:RNA 2',3'-cyclic 3'-phosphodiesterase